MNNPKPETSVPRHSCISDSSYTEYLYDDGEGSVTVSPIPPEQLCKPGSSGKKSEKAWLRGNGSRNPQEAQGHPPKSDTLD